MADLENPLDPDQFDDLERALALTGRVEKAIQRNQRLGIDVGDQLKINRDNRALLQKFKSEFFPGK